MFTYDGDIRLDACELWLDARVARPYGYVSHAHSDHIARHLRLLATPETLRLCRLRLGGKRPGDALPYGQFRELGEARLSTYSAGHVLGSAMLKVETDRGSLLYTGDFRLRPGRTCPPAEPPQADVLIMECTFGHPRYRFPNRDTVIGDFLRTVAAALAEGVSPVIPVYSLGKGQEVTRLLTEAGLPVMVHEKIEELNRVYEELGVDLGDYRSWQPGKLGGHVLLVPALARAGTALGKVRQRLTIFVSGWAMDQSHGRRWGADRSFPLSDHADFDELFELVERVNPRRVYCTHGPAEFADHLRSAGWDARALGVDSYQPLLF